MKLPWQKQSEIFYEEPKAKRKPETLKDTATKIMQRRMKKDESYGLKASERILGVSDENKTLSAQLKELKQTQQLLKELGGDSQASWVKELGSGLASALAPYLGQVIQGMQQQTGDQQQINQQPQLQKPQPVQQTSVRFTDFVPILDMKPAEAVSALYAVNPTWVNLLANSTYQSLINLLQQIQITDDIQPYMTALLSKNKRKWLEDVITEAKQAIKQAT